MEKTSLTLSASLVEGIQKAQRASVDDATMMMGPATISPTTCVDFTPWRAFVLCSRPGQVEIFSYLPHKARPTSGTMARCDILGFEIGPYNGKCR
jgi:hypothetical protein